MAADAVTERRGTGRFFSSGLSQFLAARRPFVFHHRLDFMLLVGGAISLLLTLLATSLPYRDPAQQFPYVSSLENSNTTAFFILLAVTLVASVYWLISIYRNGEIGAQPYSRSWPNLWIVWAGLLWLNLGPFLFANIAHTRIHNSELAMIGNLRSNSEIWAGIFILIYALVAGFVAHGFRLIRLRGVVEALVALVLTVGGLVAFIFLAISVEELVHPFFLSTGLADLLGPLLNKASLNEGNSIGFALSLSFLASIGVLNMWKGPVDSEAPTTWRQRQAHLMIEWLLVPGVVMLSLLTFITYNDYWWGTTLPIGVEFENWWILATVVIAVVLANWLNARAIRIGARPRA